MATPHALVEAGLEFELQEDGTRLIVRDVQPDGLYIRNRGAQALARHLAENRKIRALDLRQSKIQDNGIGHISLVLRQTDQLEDLMVSPVGLTGLELLLGPVRRCKRLRNLQMEVVDVPTLVATRQNVTKTDYNTADFAGVKAKEGEEEEEAEEEAGDDEEDAETRAQKKAEALKKIFAENDYDSEDEKAADLQVQSPVPTENEAPVDETSPGARKPASPALSRLLHDLVAAVEKNPNLLQVECLGESVPETLQLDLARTTELHREQLEQQARAKEEAGARTACDALKDQMAELNLQFENGEGTSNVDTILSGVTPGLTRVGVRNYVGQHLLAALGEALFECQRFKSKENEAVSTPEGEMAFIAMFLRKQAAGENIGKKK
mmetsp:Transcript_96220/g.206515  ORF Transcript_96220/g.206515 Transcript_96220/m.206515 type:complete len:380 (+) Transcript_96220:68-1207(+)